MKRRVLLCYALSSDSPSASLPITGLNPGRKVSVTAEAHARSVHPTTTCRVASGILQVVVKLCSPSTIHVSLRQPKTALKLRLHSSVGLLEYFGEASRDDGSYGVLQALTFSLWFVLREALAYRPTQVGLFSDKPIRTFAGVVCKIKVHPSVIQQDNSRGEFGFWSSSVAVLNQHLAASCHYGRAFLPFLCDTLADGDVKNKVNLLHVPYAIW